MWSGTFQRNHPQLKAEKDEAMEMLKKKKIEKERRKSEAKFGPVTGEENVSRQSSHVSSDHDMNAGVGTEERSERRKSVGQKLKRLFSSDKEEQSDATIR